jgi:hypothetical protein
VRLSALIAAAIAALAAAASAGAHGETFRAGYVSTVSGVAPPVPGLLAEVLPGNLLSVRNWSGKTVVLDGPDGKPLIRFARGEVHERSGAGWRLAKRGTSHAWHDPRIHWTGPTPERSGLVSRWRIRGTVDGTPFTVGGFIGYTATPTEDEGLSAGALAAIAAGAIVAMAALALPLVRRKGEDEPERSGPTKS